MLKIKTDSNKQIDIENKSIEVSDRVSADGTVTITAKAPTEIKIIKATAAKAIITDKGEIPISTEDVTSVHKVVEIIRTPFAESIKQNAATSDEFNYVKTPGTITKIFLHLFENDAVKSVHTSSGNEDETAILNQLQTQEIDNSEYFVDADGVVRYDFGTTGYANFNKIIGDDIITVFNIEFTNNSNIAEIADALTDTEGNAAAYQKLVENLTKDDVTYYDGGDYSCINPIVNVEAARDMISGNFGAHNVIALSSDKIFETGHSQDLLDIDNYSSHNLATVIEDHSEGLTNHSFGYIHGLRIIEKALETGRALDLGIVIARN